MNRPDLYVGGGPCARPHPRAGGGRPQGRPYEQKAARIS